jgi:hypothetical protein
MAPSTGDRKRNYDPVSNLQVVLQPGASLYDFAHELMAQDISFLHGRDEAVEQVQI